MVVRCVWSFLIDYDPKKNRYNWYTKLTLPFCNTLLKQFFSFQSTVTVDRNIQELQTLMHDLPDYAEQFLNMICKILEEYRDTCHSAYRGNVFF